MAPSVVIVDDDSGFRHVAAMLFMLRGFDVVAECADGSSGLAAVGVHRPDYVLIDVQLPDLSGFELAALLRERYWGIRVLLTSIDADLSVVVPPEPDVVFIPKDALAVQDLTAIFDDGCASHVGCVIPSDR